MLTHARCCTDAEIWMYSSSRRPLAYLAADGSLLPAASSVGAGASPILYNDLACCKTHTRPPTPPCTPSVQPCVRVSRVRHARLTAHLELAGRQCGAAVAKVAVPSAADGLERVERVVVHKQRGRRLTGRVAVRSDRGRLGRTCGRLLAGAHELRDVRLQQVRNVLALRAVPPTKYLLVSTSFTGFTASGPKKTAPYPARLSDEALCVHERAELDGKALVVGRPRADLAVTVRPDDGLCGMGC